MSVRLLIVVQERLFADALATWLEAEQDIEVVAALHARFPSPHLFTDGRIDLMLLDGDFPDNAAFRLCEELSQRGIAPYIIMLSHSSDARHIVRAIAAGVVGWVRKDESLDRLMYVIRGVVRGETWLPPAQTGNVLQLLLHSPDPELDGSNQLLPALTPREREVLVCLAAGTRRCDVAQNLHMSPNTVRTHLQNLMGKLGVHSAIEAVALTRSYVDDQPSQRRLVC
jgi:DNA-binding NarL/FixJ family response regulator